MRRAEHRHPIRRSTLGAVALTMMGWAYPGQAQAPSGDGSALEEIVVTAQKREEDPQTVPIAISIVSADRLDRLPTVNSSDLAHYVPGLVIGKSLFVGQSYFRGVGQSVGLPGAESPIATYLDGIYLASPAVAVFELGNVEQVAVLKGPQGTLFGRNATGGVIQVRTRDPGPRFAAEADLGYGRFDTLTGRAYATGPVAPDLSTSIAFVGKDRQHGYVFNQRTGRHLLDEKSWSVQNRWLWEPRSGLRFDLNLIHANYRNLSGTTPGVFPGTTAADGVTSYLGYRTIDNREDGIDNSHSSIASLKAVLDQGWAKISNQLSYIDFKGHAAVDLSASPGLPNPNRVPATLSDVRSHVASWSDELQIQSSDASRIKWIAGLFYLSDITRLRAANRLDATIFMSYRTRLAAHSIAGFGQATAPLGARTRLTVGVRYTSDDARLHGTTVPLTPAAALGPGHKHWQRATWRVALDHRFTADVMGYLSYDRGYKAGVFTNTQLSFPPSNPETIDAYQAGLKAELADHRVRLNLASFYYDYRNIQLRTIQNGNVLVYNAAKSRIYGGEAELEALPGGGFKLSSGLQLLHARYRDFPNGVRNDPSPLPAVPSGCLGAPGARIGGTVRLICDLSGNRMVKAPKISANAALSWVHRYGWGTASFSVQDSYSGSYYFEPDDRLRQPAYHWVDASLRWSAPGDHWNITLWGSNLADEHVFDTAVTGASTYLYGPGLPVTYGVTIGARL